jgi:hypothetical protein
MASWACSMSDSFTQDASMGWYPFHLTKYSRSRPLTRVHLNTAVAMLALGSRPRLRAKVAGQEEGSLGVKAKALQECGPRASPGVKARGSPGVTSHTPGNVRKCEGV